MFSYLVKSKLIHFRSSCKQQKRSKGHQIAQVCSSPTYDNDLITEIIGMINDFRRAIAKGEDTSTPPNPSSLPTTGQMFQLEENEDLDKRALLLTMMCDNVQPPPAPYSYVYYRSRKAVDNTVISSALDYWYLTAENNNMDNNATYTADLKNFAQAGEEGAAAPSKRTHLRERVSKTAEAVERAHELILEDSIQSPRKLATVLEKAICLSIRRRTSNLVQNWLSDNVDMLCCKKFWSQKNPDLNPMNYYVWSVVGKVIYYKSTVAGCAVAPFTCSGNRPYGFACVFNNQYVLRVYCTNKYCSIGRAAATKRWKRRFSVPKGAVFEVHVCSRAKKDRLAADQISNEQREVSVACRAVAPPCKDLQSTSRGNLSCAFSNFRNAKPTIGEPLYPADSTAGCPTTGGNTCPKVDNQPSTCDDGLCVPATGMTFAPNAAATTAPTTVATTASTAASTAAASSATSAAASSATITTTTTTTTTTTPTTTTTAAGVITPEIQATIVLMHNNRRMMAARGTVINGKSGKYLPQGANLNELTYDQYLGSQAQQFAQTCPTSAAATVNNYEYGQNVLIANTVNIPYGDLIQSAIRNWFDEIYVNGMNNKMNFTDFLATKPNPPTHFTQMVWANHRTVGCGAHRCGSNTVVVCRYAPGGNIIGQYVYQVGAPCSACNFGCNTQFSLCIVPTRS
ncbi:unnamed protein product [Nippostrongylus brasiliensis]|uniref:SCP domain-containing protein n=1 Tax=Nippostrongylus brasiliensis TaxID=27835 RepID=A0A0N4Y9U5_NIPBR|nr:unnamed protein product [Nippostrongylus brasiliensis]